MRIKEIFDRIVVGWGCDNDEVCIFIGRFSIKSCCQIELFFSQIFFDIFILNGGNTIVEFFNFFRNHIDGCYVIMLRQQCGDTEPEYPVPATAMLYCFMLIRLNNFPVRVDDIGFFGDLRCCGKIICLISTVLRLFARVCRSVLVY